MEKYFCDICGKDITDTYGASIEIKFDARSLYPEIKEVLLCSKCNKEFKKQLKNLLKGERDKYENI